MGTKNKPGAFDCYNEAEPDEPMFVLLARDPIAPLLVQLWTQLRAKTRGVDGKVVEASSCARQMEAWQRDRGQDEARNEVATAWDQILMLEHEAASISGEELARLRAAATKLRKLEDAGVDSWGGYCDALAVQDRTCCASSDNKIHEPDCPNR